MKRCGHGTSDTCVLKLQTCQLKMNKKISLLDQRLDVSVSSEMSCVHVVGIVPVTGSIQQVIARSMAPIVKDVYLRIKAFPMDKICVVYAGGLWPRWGSACCPLSQQHRPLQCLETFGRTGRCARSLGSENIAGLTLID